MIVLKTKNKWSVPFNRMIVETEVYLEIKELRITFEGILAYGDYFIYYNDNKEIIDEITPSLLTWDQLGVVEKTFSLINRTSSLQDVIKQRLLEFTLLKLQMEGLQNYSINPLDWSFHE